MRRCGRGSEVNDSQEMSSIPHIVKDYTTDEELVWAVRNSGERL